jgi:hypothetical protein
LISFDKEKILGTTKLYESWIRKPNQYNIIKHFRSDPYRSFKRIMSFGVSNLQNPAKVELSCNNFSSKINAAYSNPASLGIEEKAIDALVEIVNKSAQANFNYAKTMTVSDRYRVFLLVNKMLKDNKKLLDFGTPSGEIIRTILLLQYFLFPMSILYSYIYVFEQPIALLASNIESVQNTLEAFDLMRYVKTFTRVMRPIYKDKDRFLKLTTTFSHNELVKIQLSLTHLYKGLVTREVK